MFTKTVTSTVWKTDDDTKSLKLWRYGKAECLWVLGPPLLLWASCYKWDLLGQGVASLQTGDWRDFSWEGQLTSGGPKSKWSDSPLRGDLTQLKESVPQTTENRTYLKASPKAVPSFKTRRISPKARMSPFLPTWPFRRSQAWPVTTNQEKERWAMHRGQLIKKKFGKFRVKIESESWVLLFWLSLHCSKIESQWYF